LRSPRSSRLLAVYAAVACGFSIAPVAVIFLESLTGADYVSFPPVGLSLKWYLEIPKRQQQQHPHAGFLRTGAWSAEKSGAMPTGV
jgi:ABC-type spermidine/putrescine transport system permease subunit II